jgi:hypothetical protein
MRIRECAIVSTGLNVMFEALVPSTRSRGSAIPHEAIVVASLGVAILDPPRNARPA